MATEADRLLAEGKPITLSDGTTLYVRYGMRSIKMLEDNFGSVTAALAHAETAVNEHNQLVGPTLALLVPGLSQYRENGTPLYTEETLLDALDSRHLSDYLTAAMQAIAEAIPGAEMGDRQEGNAQTPAASASPGVTSTGSQPSVSEGAMASSGI